MSWKLQLAFGVILLVLVALQYRLWVGEGSFAEVVTLKRQLAAQRAELADLYERNATLQAEVDDLKDGLAAIEARARSELGLIREGETYFQLLPPEGKARD
ncbi:MAG TPA: cell division protein FtsB [Gammaproteobacteria bacterium]|nr:cell division protein FtsB [Gammaproteobacteria bacterium]